MVAAARPQMETWLGCGPMPFSGGLFLPLRRAIHRRNHFLFAVQTEYERLGHAEVVGVELRGTTQEKEAQLQAFARVYFSQFRSTPFGMLRQVISWTR